MRHFGKGISIVSCAIAAVALLGPAASSGATFAVNTQNDTTVAGGCLTDPACSLRDAVGAANASADPVDIVEVPAGRYILTAGQLGASTGLTIRGAGARSTTIDAAGASRVFSLGTGNFILEGITVTGGLASIADVMSGFAGDGGGILVVSASAASSLTLNRVAVTGNVAQLNGGGISAPPESGFATKVIVNESTISGNRVSGGLAEGLGGGIYVLGDLAITNSTIAGNSVENPGANSGGGVLAGIEPAELEGTSTTLLNTTIAGNSVAAGGIGGGFAINNPTAGVVTAFNAKNTIVSGNTAGGAAAECSGVVTVTSANNLSGDSSCGFSDGGSRQGVSPGLGALQNNGGPTDTMALPGGSPAIDAGTNDGCPPTDQRGISRPQGPACDIGAFELARVAAATPSADLKLTLKPKPKRFRPGKKLRFLLTVSNAGPSAATDVVVNGAVPAGTRKAKGKKVAGRKPCKVANPKRAQTKVGKRKRKLTCGLGSLAPGATTKLTIVVRSGTAHKVRAQAQVRSSTSDPGAKNNKAKAVAKALD